MNITTVHGAKGLEADYAAAIMDMTDRTYMSMNACQENMDEEHRVAYVAMTRAKKIFMKIEPISNKAYRW